ncbi:hypothetical protein DFH06DRAFT_919067, partial [Mycena polygramma]
ARSAPVHFLHIDKLVASQNGHLGKAKAAAKLGCSFPRANGHPTAPTAVVDFSTTIIDTPKVDANIGNNSGVPEAKNRVPRPEFPANHRGRDKLVALKEANRKKVTEAASSGVFWKEIKRLSDPKPAPISVTAASLKEVFEKRLNPPKILPSQFDAAQHGINKILARLLPDKTEDDTPEGFFSQKFNEKDMGRLKDHLRKHSLDSS